MLQMVVYTTDQSKRQKLDDLSPPTINRDEHVESTTSPAFYCDMCVEPFETQQEENEHRKTCGPQPETIDQDADGKFECSQCPKIYDTKAQQTRHMRVKHGKTCVRQPTEKGTDADADGFFNCSKCPNKFDKKWKLSAHMRNVHGPRQPCLHVDCVHRTPFTTKGNLKIHMDQLHRQICRLPCLVESCEGNTKSFDGLFGCQDSLDMGELKDQHFHP